MIHIRHLLCLLLLGLSSTVHASSQSIAFYYHSHLPLAEMTLYSRVVVQPDQVTPEEIQWLQQRKIKTYAYLSVGESRTLGKKGLVTNKSWNSQVMDLTSDQWQSELFEQARKLKEQGYQGLFLDTLDSYQMLPAGQQQEQQRSLVRIIKKLSMKFSHHLILNRGFSMLPQLQDEAEYVVAEGLFTHFNPQGDKYGVSTAAGQQWLSAQLHQAKALGFQVQVIDYAKPDKRFEIAQKIVEAGFLPWVTDGHLRTWGTSDLYPVARKILIPFNSRIQYLSNADVHYRLASFIEYLGYIPVYIDLSKQSMPEIDPAIHAGVISWAYRDRMYTPDYIDWLIQAKATLPVMVLGQLPDSDILLNAFGVRMLSSVPGGPYQVTMIKPWLKGEQDSIRPGSSVYALQMEDNQKAEPLITITAADGTSLVQGVKAGNSVLIAAPWLIENLSRTDSRWMIDPLQLLSRAFALPPIPVPDLTTESGRRRLINYIDGDAFPSLARLPGQPIAAKVILDQVIKPYKLPITVSIVEGEVGPKGLYPEKSPYYEKIAKQIFAQPYVDMATHTFSHPFFWNELAGRQRLRQKIPRPYGRNLAVPNYDKIDLHREIVGSVDYINQRLAPKGQNKKVTAVLWSGDALPGSEPLRIVQDAGLVNMNGGDTFVTADNPSLSRIAPLGRPESEVLYQIYAPLMNEELYTNEWHGPYDGFKRLIETFKLTEKPYRLKPFTIYYHFYSGTNPAGVRALRTVIDYALSKPNTPIQLVHYARSAKDFYFSALARNSQGEWVFNSKWIPTLRLPQAVGEADLQHSRGIAGMTEDGRYLHLPDGKAVFKTVKQPVTVNKPYLVSANVVIKAWSDSRVEFYSWLKAQLVMANAAHCKLKSSKGKTYQGKEKGKYQVFSLPRGSFSGHFECRQSL